MDRLPTGCRGDPGRFHRRFCRRQFCGRLRRRKPRRLKRARIRIGGGELGPGRVLSPREMRHQRRVAGVAHHECNKMVPKIVSAWRNGEQGVRGNHLGFAWLQMLAGRRLWGPCGTEEREVCAWKFKNNEAFLGCWRPAPGVGSSVRALLAFPEGPVGGRGIWLVPPESGGAAAGFSLRLQDG